MSEVNRRTFAIFYGITYRQLLEEKNPKLVFIRYGELYAHMQVLHMIFNYDFNILYEAMQRLERKINLWNNSIA